MSEVALHGNAAFSCGGVPRPTLAIWRVQRRQNISTQTAKQDVVLSPRHSASSEQAPLTGPTLETNAYWAQLDREPDGQTVSTVWRNILDTSHGGSPRTRKYASSLSSWRLLASNARGCVSCGAKLPCPECWVRRPNLRGTRDLPGWNVHLCRRVQWRSVRDPRRLLWSGLRPTRGLRRRELRVREWRVYWS